MGQLTVRLPTTLHEQLRERAAHEGVSLNHYVLYALTRQVTLAYTVQPVSEAQQAEQKAAFTALLERLGRASFPEIQAVLDEREVVTGEHELTPEVIDQLQQRLEEQAHSKR
jgi:primosomal protein N'